MFFYNIALCVSIVVVVYLAAYVLVKSDSTKKIWYFATLVCAFLFLLGDLLGKTSSTLEGAFLGTKIEYLGSSTLTSALLLFVADFCRVKIRRLFKVLLWVIPFTVIILLWTTEYHGLIYAKIDFAQIGMERLKITAGPLHLVVHIYSLLTAIAALVLLTHRFFKGNLTAERKINIFLLILGVLIPVAANVLYVLKIVPFNITPLLLTLSSVVFFFNTVQFNMLDIMQLASKMALQSIKEALVLTDENSKFVHANKAARTLFPQFAGLRAGQSMSSVRGWPFVDLDKTDISSPIPFETAGSHFIANISVITEREDSPMLGYIILVQNVTESVLLTEKLTQQHSAMLEAVNAMRESINYAGKIQRNLLPPDTTMTEVFSDCSVIWKPRDVVGGDIYWMKHFDAGTVLCVADCTGHGTPGALLTMLVTSALENIVSAHNCNDTAGIIFRLDQRLSSVLHVDSGTERFISDIDDGCDIAVLFIANDGSVTFSSGKLPVFICDGNDVTRHKGQKLYIGEGRLKSKDEVTAVSIPANPQNKFYIASDGLSDQPGGPNGVQFGYKVFQQLILDNHREKQAAITGKVWDAFEDYRGNEVQRDDFVLLAFQPHTGGE